MKLAIVLAFCFALTAFAQEAKIVQVSPVAQPAKVVKKHKKHIKKAKVVAAPVAAPTAK